MKAVLITSIPSPYRVTVFNEINLLMGDDFLVIYTSSNHPAFKWEKTKLNHHHVFMNENTNHNLDNEKGIYKKLKLFNPEVIITCGFNPTMLKGMLFGFINNKKLIANTDAWELNEKSYSFLHILIRKILYKKMNAFIPVSKKGCLNFLNYGIKKEQIFISHYAIDNNYSSNYINTKKEFDLLFSGQFIERKMPFFFCDIIEEISHQKKDIKILLLGDGILKNQIKDRLNKLNVNYTYLGFVQPNELPKYYAQSKIFLFPTKLDSWGVVTNDACAVGTPVITCDNAGAAEDLIINNYNGFVLPLDTKIWAEHVMKLLNDELLYHNFSKNSLIQIQKYNAQEAAEGIINALNFAIK